MLLLSTNIPYLCCSNRGNVIAIINKSERIIFCFKDGFLLSYVVRRRRPEALSPPCTCLRPIHTLSSFPLYLSQDSPTEQEIRTKLDRASGRVVIEQLQLWKSRFFIPHICHEPGSCKFFLAGVNFYRFNAINWQFTVYFAVITQKIGNFLCILS